MAKDAPEPAGPTGGSMEADTPCPPCGHSACGKVCKVRYVGPVSSMRDHHILHAAQGASHIWAAAIIAGLAVVLTGAIAFSVAQAQTDMRIEDVGFSVKQGVGKDVRNMAQEIAGLKAQIQQMSASSCHGTVK